MSDGLWRSQFGGDPGAVGKDIRIDGQPYTVVGVMPRGFEALAPGISLWRPLAFTAEREVRRAPPQQQLVERRRGSSRARRSQQAQAQVDALNAANLERFPQYKELLINAGFHTQVDRFPDHLVRDVKPILYLLWGGALFVLLIGCVNVANLALVRARVRAKEMATRLALGAPTVAARAPARDGERRADGRRGRRGPRARRSRAAIRGELRLPGPALREGDPPRRRRPRSTRWRSRSRSAACSGCCRS